MTGTERKRAWRLRNPERRRTAERERAQARRDGDWNYWRTPSLGQEPRPCGSHNSYWRYEHTLKRMKQRMFWPRYGAGTTTMTREEFRARGREVLAEAVAHAKIEATGDQR
jgi:hypothetical protein